MASQPSQDSWIFNFQIVVPEHFAEFFVDNIFYSKILQLEFNCLAARIG